jgi:hypothetical protein
MRIVLGSFLFGKRTEQQKETALLALKSVSRYLLLQAVSGITRGIFDVASCLMHLTLGLVGLTFVFEFLVAGELTSALLYRSFGLIRSSLYMLSIHRKTPCF